MTLTGLASGAVDPPAPEGAAGVPRLVEDWRVSLDLERPRAVDVDLQGRAYVVDEASCRVQVLGPRGEPLHAFGRSGSRPDGQFLQPSGITAGGGFHIVVADAGNGRLARYLTDVEGARWAFDRILLEQGGLAGGLFRPVAVAFDPGGALAVVDGESGEVLLLDEFGRIERRVGGFGDLPGRLRRPVSVAYDRRRGLFVADPGRDRVSCFDRFGSHLADWPIGSADGADAGLRGPTGLALDREGRLAVAEPGAARVVLISSAGAVLTRWPRPPEPVDVAFGPKGGLYVVDGTTSTLSRCTLAPPR
jgi:hypothetical protein